MPSVLTLSTTRSSMALSRIICSVQPLCPSGGAEQAILAAADLVSFSFFSPYPYE